MQRFMAVCVSLVTIAGAAAVFADDAGPAKDVPELQALQHYHGTWDVAVTDNEFSTGESTARWILGGRFLEQAGVMHSKDGKEIGVTTLFTFDTNKKTYRSWMFFSTGSVSQAEMTWDAKSKTMTSLTRPNADGVRSTVTADFSEASQERWKFVFTDRDGKAAGEMRGVNTLRKDAATTPKPAATAKDFSNRTAELKVLDRFLGTWRTEYRMPKAEWTPEEKRGSAELVYTRELDGQFIRERGTDSDKTTTMITTMLLTFDADKQNYRGWWFDSLGNTNESTGRWDEASRTLFWTRIEPNDFNNTSQHSFPDSGKFDWKVLVQDKQGVAMFRMEGTSLRVPTKK
ncbi:MAG: DUF1579 family protein [Candidatus Saccharimonas sp.]|nr:DUF1579 family protein [Planctomycetaceae bacterium]